jgi:hypothetical protein
MRASGPRTPTRPITRTGLVDLLISEVGHQAGDRPDHLTRRAHRRGLHPLKADRPSSRHGPGGGLRRGHPQGGGRAPHEDPPAGQHHVPKSGRSVSTIRSRPSWAIGHEHPRIDARSASPSPASPVCPLHGRLAAQGEPDAPRRTCATDQPTTSAPLGSRLRRSRRRLLIRRQPPRHFRHRRRPPRPGLGGGR